MIKITKKRAISLILTAVMVLAALPASVFGAEHDGHWAEANINKLIEMGVVDEAGGNTNPDGNVTRAQLAKMLVEAFGIEPSIEADFADVLATDWHHYYISAAVGAGLFKGDGDGKMRPDAAITREEATTVFARQLGLADEDAQAGLGIFSDAADISPWALEPVCAAVDNGLVNGSNGMFKPKANMTRAEAMTIIVRMLETEEEPASPESEAVEVKEGETFGSATEVTTVENVVVTGSATLLNLNITGDLIIDESVGDGTVILEGVKVAGTTYVNGGGAHSVEVKNSELQEAQMSYVVVAKVSVSIRLESGEIQNVEFTVEATLVVSEDGTVQVVDVNTNEPVTLTGTIDSVQVTVEGAEVKLENAKIDKLIVTENAKDANITLDKDTEVNQAVTDAVINLLGSGAINDLNSSVEGVKSEITPNTESGTGKAEVNTPPPAASGGNTGGSSDSPFVMTADKVPVNIKAMGTGTEVTGIPSHVQYPTSVTKAEDLAAAFNRLHVFFVGEDENKTISIDSGVDHKYYSVEWSISADVNAVSKENYSVDGASGGVFVGKQATINVNGNPNTPSGAYNAGYSYTGSSPSTKKPQLLMTVVNINNANDKQVYEIYLVPVAIVNVTVNDTSAQGFGGTIYVGDIDHQADANTGPNIQEGVTGTSGTFIKMIYDASATYSKILAVPNSNSKVDSASPFSVTGTNVTDESGPPVTYSTINGGWKSKTYNLTVNVKFVDTSSS